MTILTTNPNYVFQPGFWPRWIHISKKFEKKCAEQNDEFDEDYLEMAKGVGKCQLCQNIVVRSVDCPNCQVNYHLYCVFQTVKDDRPEIGKCKACSADVPIRIKTKMNSNSSK